MSFDFSTRNYEDLLREGIMAAKSGRRALAQRLLHQANRMNPTDSRPWVWLSQTTDNLEERIRYLEKAVSADPSDATARRGLAILNGKLDPESLLREGEAPPARTPQEPQEASVSTFACPNCGGSMRFDLDRSDLVCDFCGYVENTAKEALDELTEQSVDLVLPTQRGHLWAEYQHHLACDRCGAVSLLNKGEQTTRCNYCGSNQLVETGEYNDLVDPQVIGLMILDKEAAVQAVRKWFRSGLFTPDDLKFNAKKMDLRSAYYPFWIFDGTLEARWRCEVREGSGNTARWVPRNGTEFVMFKDLLIPGVKGIPLDRLPKIEPFNLEELVVFNKEYLVGWQALYYDRSMADASLLARERVVRDLRKTIHRRVEAGSEKRDLDVGGGKWSGLTFKLAMLPLWVGSYHYKNQDYSIIVNGQTGKVTGQKPRDRTKMALIWTAGGLTVIVMGLLILMAFLLFSN